MIREVVCDLCTKDTPAPEQRHVDVCRTHANMIDKRQGAANRFMCECGYASPRRGGVISHQGHVFDKAGHQKLFELGEDGQTIAELEPAPSVANGNKKNGNGRRRAKSTARKSPARKKAKTSR